MGRRSFLTGASAMLLSQLLAGCSGQSQSTLTVRSLSGSVPPQILNEFRKGLSNAALNVSPEAELQTLFTLLQTWKQEAKPPSASRWPSWVPFVGSSEAAIPDLVTLGDYWLEKAIQQQLIAPLDPTQLQGWAQLPLNDRWKAIVTRNAQGQLDAKGQVWGAPYRWGSTVIAYRTDIFREKGLQPPTDWSDLWRSDLRRHLSLLDQPREVIGLTLKKLGKSYNTQDLGSVPDLDANLRALQQQAKLYSSSAYLQPLILGDTWLAVGWSTDILPIIRRNPNIAVVIPQSGTALWTDMWVRPAATSTASSLATQWINFCWQPSIAAELALLSRASSPAVLRTDRASLPQALRDNPILLPDTAILEASEFLQPLPTATVQQYRDRWKTLRQAVS
ncbi:extracellular solute-binding protein [Leptolyngbya sp. FACHB-36]|nr:extracellular solute-binding protein [Leptolyngbya sp. FACHB-36]